ncbi:substrate-binding domain-containing protein, partial [Pseudomonas aeruginosa]
CRPQHPLLGKDSLSTNDLFNYPLASTLIPPGIRKLLANLSGKIDFAANIRCENMHALIRIVRQTDAIGIASDETLRPYLQRGELQPLQWRNLPQNLDSLSARCGIISRSGYRLSAAAKAMIETLVELDQAQHAAA